MINESYVFDVKKGFAFNNIRKDKENISNMQVLSWF